jgi:hypothetical protein
VSSDFDRQLRDARETLPTPGEEGTLRARRHVLATIRHGRRRTRILILAGAMLVAAVVLGATTASLNAPSVTAAPEPPVIGFVPEPGWFALQSPPPAVAGQQTAAVAANVPFAADDVVHGLVEPSGLPYSTLLRLPPDGIVIVTTMVPETELHLAPINTNPAYPEVELPLRLRDGVPWVQWGAQVRPDQPLAQYQLRASIEDYNVDVVVYFGTSHPSDALLAEAQRQLSALVVRSALSAPAATTAVVAPATQLVVVDRTYVCRATQLGGIYELKSRAHSGVRAGSGWSTLPYVVAASGGWAGPRYGLHSAPGNSLAWISAGAPSAGTTVDLEVQTFPVLEGGTLGVNNEQCRPSTAAVPLTSAGLRGGSADRAGAFVDCFASRRMLIRFRATVQGTSGALRDRARIFLATSAPVREAKLAVRTPAGKPIAYADVSESGKARLFTAKGCTRE